MRYDMHEVVIERPRSGGRGKYPRNSRRCRDRENLPAKEGMTRPWILSGDQKAFSDLLGPLRKFLVSRVGRRWDDVYSEIRERLNPSSTVQIHIMNHLFGFVEINPILGEDGAAWSTWRFGGPYRKAFPGALYVHPVTGVLCRVPEGRSPWKRRKKIDPDKKIVDGREMRRIDGIWYEVEEVTEIVPVHDSERNVLHYLEQHRLLKRQLGNRDLRRHGLSND